MSSLVPDFEPPSPDLPAEMERLRHQPPGDADPNERLAALTDQCAEIVRNWAEISERLTQVYLTTADTAQRNFERSEARLAGIERDIDRRMSELASQLQMAVTEMRVRSARPEPAGAGSAPWSLESVTRLHQELRDPGSAEGALVPARPPGPPAPHEPAGVLPEAASALSDRISSLERSLADRDSQIQESVARTARATRAWRWAGAIFLVLLGLTAAFALRTERLAQRATARVEAAQRETEAARTAATQEIEAVRADAARDTQEANERAIQAQLVGDVLAAPDVLRYNLTGRDALAGASAELRFSRTRGIVFNGSRMFAPPPGSTYQIWLITRLGPVKAASFTPNPAGVATIALAPFAVPRPVTGAMVTIEPIAGSDAPSGDPVLERPNPPPS